MGDREFLQSASDEIDLSKNTAFSQKIEPSKQSDLAADLAANDTGSVISGFGNVETVPLQEVAPLEKELPIPDFLLKNKKSGIVTSEAEADDENTFVDRSYKMVQDACKALSDGDISPNPGGEAANVAAGTTEGPSERSTHRNWIFSASFAAVVAGAAVFYWGQPNIFAGHQATNSADKSSQFLQIASNSPAHAGWGISLTQNNATRSLVAHRPDTVQGVKNQKINLAQANAASAQRNNVTSGKTLTSSIILDNSQNSSLNARLSSAQAVSFKKQVAKIAPKPVIQPVAVRRSQIADLVKEQTQPKAARALKDVDAAARELEAEIQVASAQPTSSASIRKVVTRSLKPAPAVSPLTPEPTITAPKQAKKTAPSAEFQLAQISAANAQKLEKLTNSVVDQLDRLKKFEQNPQTAEIPASSDLRSSIADLVKQATSQNLDSTAISALLKEAVGKTNSVPSALANADGTLDTRLLLKSVLSQVDTRKAEKSADKDYLSALDDEGSSTVITTSLETPKVSVVRPKIQNNSRIVTNGSKRTIKIIKGDTLSKIALLVYGDVLSYTDIFRANRDKLKSPNLLIVGVVLKLP